MSPPDFLFSFNGRIRRLHFWLYLLCLSVVSSGTLFGITGPQPDLPHYGLALMHPQHAFWGQGLLVAALSLVFLWSKLAVFTRRWHDRNKSGLWSLILLIPVIGVIWFIVECGFLEGTVGDNQYGSDPKH